MSIWPPKVIDGKKYYFRGITKTRESAIKRCNKIKEHGYLAFYRKSLAKSNPGFIIWGTAL